MRKKKIPPVPPVEVKNLTDLVLDDQNANEGTIRGRGIIEDSLNTDGAGRGILLDRKGRVIAGNKTTEIAVDRGFEHVIVVHTTGKQLVAVQRDDVDLDSEQGRRMAITDNRAAELNLSWAGPVLDDLRNRVDLSKLWDQDEIDAMLKRAPTLEELEGKHGGGSETDLFVTLSFKVSPTTRNSFMLLWATLAGKDENEKMIDLISKVGTQ